MGRAGAGGVSRGGVVARQNRQDAALRLLPGKTQHFSPRGTGPGWGQQRGPSARLGPGGEREGRLGVQPPCSTQATVPTMLTAALLLGRGRGRLSMSVLDTWAWAAACSGPSSLCCHSRAPWPGDIAVTVRVLCVPGQSRGAGAGGQDQGWGLALVLGLGQAGSIP